MNCEECNDLVYDYLDGSLSPEDALSFEQALTDCDHCAERLAQARNIRASLQSNPSGRPIGNERRSAIIAAARAKADEFKRERTEPAAVIPFPGKIAGWSLAAAAVLAGVIGYWVLQMNWEQPTFSRGSESESMARADQVSESESRAGSSPSELTGEQTTRDSVRGGVGSADETNEMVHDDEQPQVAAAPPASADLPFEPADSEPAEANVGDEDQITAERERQAEVASRERSARSPQEAPSRREAGATRAESDSVPARPERRGNQEPAQAGRSQAAGALAGVARESERSDADMDDEAARFGSGSSGGSTGRGAVAPGGALEESVADRGADRAGNEREAPVAAAPSEGSRLSASRSARSERVEAAEPQASAGAAQDLALEADDLSEPAPAVEERPTVRQELTRMRNQMEAGSPAGLLSIGNQLSQRADLTSDERAELYFLMGTAEESRGDQDAAATYYQRSVNQGIGTSYGRTSYQRLQTISR